MVGLVWCVTLLWLAIFLFSLQIFNDEFRETNIEKWPESFLMIPFLSFNEVSKIKFVNILSIKETVFDVTPVGLVVKGNVTMFENSVAKQWNF